MSYYFCIVGTKDNPLFELEFGTSKQGGDGIARFPTEARQLNPFIVHASLDIVEEVQWLNSQMLVSAPWLRAIHAMEIHLLTIGSMLRYLKRVDHFASSHVSCFLTPTSVKFMLLHLPHPPNTAPSTVSAAQNPNVFPPFGPYTTTTPPSSLLRASTSSSSGNTAAIPNNPTSPQTEEALRLFFTEVYEAWVKAVMNPFQNINKTLGSPVFKARVVTAGRKFL
ncbi:TRAPP subunit [Xylographa soralifera]|nr:TRAPP subunit [Xylographa soralifera]